MSVYEAVCPICGEVVRVPISPGGYVPWFDCMDAGCVHFRELNVSHYEDSEALEARFGVRAERRGV